MESDTADPISAIRKAASAKNLRPYALAHAGRLSVSTWQLLLDGDPGDRLAWGTIRDAMAQLGIKAVFCE